MLAMYTKLNFFLKCLYCAEKIEKWCHLLVSNVAATIIDSIYKTNFEYISIFEILVLFVTEKKILASVIFAWFTTWTGVSQVSDVKHKRIKKINNDTHILMQLLSNNGFGYISAGVIAIPWCSSFKVLFFRDASYSISTPTLASERADLYIDFLFYHKRLQRWKEFPNKNNKRRR